MGCRFLKFDIYFNRYYSVNRHILKIYSFSFFFFCRQGDALREVNQEMLLL